MSSTQTKLRGGTSAQIAAMTPVEKEVVVNTTTDRIHIGDGSKAGGHVVPNMADVQNQAGVAATVGGTANAITLTNSLPISAYATHQRFVFKATATNTGAVTVDVDGVGAKNIYKISAGSLTALAAGDIINGGLYAITYDGTQFQLGGTGGGGAEASTAEIAGESAVAKSIRPDRLKYGPGVAKVWLSTTSTGTAIGDSYGVSSLSLPAGGQTRVNFSTAFANANYSAIPVAISGTADYARIVPNQQTSYCDVGFSGGTRREFNLTIHGDI